MFNFVKGLTGAVVKTAVDLPVAMAADIITIGGNLTDKCGDRLYTGDMMKSIGDSIEEMTD